MRVVWPPYDAGTALDSDQNQIADFAQALKDPNTGGTASANDILNHIQDTNKHLTTNQREFIGGHGDTLPANAPLGALFNLHDTNTEGIAGGIYRMEEGGWVLVSSGNTSGTDWTGATVASTIDDTDRIPILDSNNNEKVISEETLNKHINGLIQFATETDLANRYASTDPDRPEAVWVNGAKYTWDNNTSVGITPNDNPATGRWVSNFNLITHPRWNIIADGSDETSKVQNFFDSPLTDCLVFPDDYCVIGIRSVDFKGKSIIGFSPDNSIIQILSGAGENTLTCNNKEYFYIENIYIRSNTNFLDNYALHLTSCQRFDIHNIKIRGSGFKFESCWIFTFRGMVRYANIIYYLHEVNDGIFTINIEHGKKAYMDYCNALVFNGSYETIEQFNDEIFSIEDSVGIKYNLRYEFTSNSLDNATCIFSVGKQKYTECTFNTTLLSGLTKDVAFIDADNAQLTLLGTYIYADHIYIKTTKNTIIDDKRVLINDSNGQRSYAIPFQPPINYCHNNRISIDHLFNEWLPVKTNISLEKDGIRLSDNSNNTGLCYIKAVITDNDIINELKDAETIYFGIHVVINSLDYIKPAVEINTVIDNVNNYKMLSNSQCVPNMEQIIYTNSKDNLDLSSLNKIELYIWLQNANSPLNNETILVKDIFLGKEKGYINNRPYYKNSKMVLSLPRLDHNYGDVVVLNNKEYIYLNDWVINEYLEISISSDITKSIIIYRGVITSNAITLTFDYDSNTYDTGSSLTIDNSENTNAVTIAITDSSGTKSILNANGHTKVAPHGKAEIEIKDSGVFLTGDTTA